MPANHKNKLWDKYNLSAVHCYAVAGTIRQLYTNVYGGAWFEESIFANAL